MTFIAIGLSILVSGVFTGCSFLQPLFEATPADSNTPGVFLPPPAAAILTAAAAAVPPPYKEILLVISAMLTSGIFIDNRRKDTVIKVLKSANDDQTEIISNTLNPRLHDPPG